MGTLFLYDSNEILTTFFKRFYARPQILQAV